MDPAAIFLLQATLILGLPPLLWQWKWLKRLVPLAVVQKAWGIALGPSLLGWIAPGTSAFLFSPSDVIPLNALSNMSVTLFTLVIAMHLDKPVGYLQRQAFYWVGIGGLVVPLGIGFITARLLANFHPDLVMPGSSVNEFAVAFGICVAVTALPMLGAILRDLRLLDHRLGHLALRSAMLTDTAAWVLLALLLARHAERQLGDPLALLLAGGLAFIGVMFSLVRPILTRLADRIQRGELQLVIVVLIGFIAGFITQVIGLHFVLGAFVAGLTIPDRWKRQVLDQIEVMTSVLLLPFFFTVVGLRVSVLISSTSFFELLVASLSVAMAGKLIGTVIPARLGGEDWRDAIALGALMQSKGVFVFIALLVLSDKGIITSTTFSALAIMALLSDASCMMLVRLAQARRRPLALSEAMVQRLELP